MLEIEKYLSLTLKLDLKEWSRSTVKHSQRTTRYLYQVTYRILKQRNRQTKEKVAKEAVTASTSNGGLTTENSK